MATITGLTAERLIEMENATIISGSVVGSNLILHKHDGGTVDAGSVIGPIGPAGASFIVCTSGTRPSLTSGEAGKAIYETDTKLIRVWTGTRWRLQEKVICTSSTRPSMVAGDEGVKIYETDTDLELTWDGSTWKSDNNSVFVPVYANEAARTADNPSPTEGAISYLSSDPALMWIYVSGVWHIVGDPPGTISPYFGVTPPAGHCLMYGQVIAGADVLYPVLWANVYSGFKLGSSLIIPDMRGYVIAGKTNMGGGAPVTRLTFSGATSQAGTGGSEEVQQHSHSINDPGHHHAVGETLIYSGSYGVVAGGKQISLVTADAYTGISVNNYGTGTGKNVQPTITMNMMLKLL